MTCSFCDYIGAGLLAIPMAASELTSPRWRSGEWGASKAVRRSPAVIRPCYLKKGSRRQFLGGTAKSSNSLIGGVTNGLLSSGSCRAHRKATCQGSRPLANAFRRDAARPSSKLETGKIRRESDYWDAATFMKQVGVLRRASPVSSRGATMPGARFLKER